MKNSENILEFTVKQLNELSDGLPFEVESAWNWSSYYIGMYLEEHANNGAGLDTKKSALMAAGRLYWLLREARPTLDGLFSEADIFILLNCYQGNMFYPEQMNSIASDLCNDLGIELEKYEESSSAPLIEKLRNLNTLQRITLADALEQNWYRGMQLGYKRPREFFESLGIRLS